MSLSTLWQDCLSQLQDQVSPMDLSTWLRPLQADVISQDQVVLYASNMFVKSWVENHYLAQIHQICHCEKSKFTNYRKRRGKTSSKSC